MPWSSTPSAVRIKHRPADGNAFTLDMARESLAAPRDAESDPNVHVPTLTGEGRFLCAGGDVTSMASFEPGDRPAFLRELADAAHDIALATHSREP